MLLETIEGSTLNQFFRPHDPITEVPETFFAAQTLERSLVFAQEQNSIKWCETETISFSGSEDAGAVVQLCSVDECRFCIAAAWFGGYVGRLLFLNSNNFYLTSQKSKLISRAISMDKACSMINIMDRKDDELEQQSEFTLFVLSIPVIRSVPTECFLDISNGIL